MSLRSPLSRVLGSGSAKEGTDHWWLQRVTAVALIVLGLWFLFSLANVQDYSRDGLRNWIGDPLNAVLLLLTSITVAWHSLLGVQVIVEDYVHSSGLKIVALLANKFIHGFLAAVAVLAILKLALGDSL